MARQFAPFVSGIVLLIGLSVSGLPTAVAESPEIWQVIYISGQRVGYGRGSSVKEVRKGATVFVTNVEQHLTIRRFGQQLKIELASRYEDTESGQLLGFTSEMRNPPAQSTKSVGKVLGNILEIETTINGVSKTQSLELDPNAKSPAYQDRQLQLKPLQAGETRTYKMFVPEFAKVAEVKVIADDLRLTKLHDNSERKLLKVKVSNSLQPSADIRMFLDPTGESLKSETDLLGLVLVTYAVPQAVAIQAIVGAELDVAVGTLVRLDKPTANLMKSKRAVLRVTTPGKDPSQLLSNNENQTVKKVADNVVEVTLVGSTIPKMLVSGSSKQKQYLGETPYLQSQNARVQEHARKAAAGSEDPGTIASRMERYVFEQLKKKNFSTALASAAEVAERMEGDCTEHACLLAAMLRAQQIPSRVAVGLVYVEKFSAFGGHMWAEAWLDGKWVAVDGTLGMGGIGPSHIKLADSDLGDPGQAPVAAFLPLMNLLNQLKIEVISIEE